MLIKKVFFILLILNILNADDYNINSIKAQVFNTAMQLDKKYNIDKKIILAYIKTESAFKPYPIAIKADNQKLVSQFYNIMGIKNKKYGSKYVSISPKNRNEAKIAYDMLLKNKDIFQVKDYDLGIMQINTRNIKRYGIDEKETYLNYRQNMLYGADIIRGCYDILKNKTNINNILECYNRGSSIKFLNKSNRTYLAKFLKNYKDLNEFQ